MEIFPDYYYVPIIATTAHAMVDVSDISLQEGMNDYITNPINVSKIKSVLDLFLGSNKY